MVVHWPVYAGSEVGNYRRSTAHKPRRGGLFSPLSDGSTERAARSHIETTAEEAFNVGRRMLASEIPAI